MPVLRWPPWHSLWQPERLEDGALKGNPTCSYNDQLLPVARGLTVSIWSTVLLHMRRQPAACFVFFSRGHVFMVVKGFGDSTRKSSFSLRQAWYQRSGAASLARRSCTSVGS